MSENDPDNRFAPPFGQQAEPRPAAPDAPPASIGYVVGGGLRENLRVRLTVPAQEVQEGAFVVIESGDWQFYGLVTDLQLGATDPRFADEQSEARMPARLAGLLHGQTLYTNLEVLPALMLERGPDPGDAARYAAWREKLGGEEPHPMPVKTIPPHHAPARMAGEGDVAEIFGVPGEAGNFVAGYTREQGLPVCINLDKFVQRSSGIFGATGTGKSFLTRLLLAGVIQYDHASTLIFDMHNEYGPNTMDSDTGAGVPGLRSKFPAKVVMVGLGRGAAIRDQAPDFTLELAESDIQPEDIEMLTRELNLKETTPTTLEALVSEYGRGGWFARFREMRVGAVVENEEGKRVPAPDSVAAWANAAGVNVLAAEGLRSKLNRVFDLPYLVPQPGGKPLEEIILALKAGKHVVLSFGKHDRDLDYLLVTNLLTRRIRAEWEKLTEAYHRGGDGQPRPLVIVVEEAHKLLNREMAAQTTFSTIAREMRKYFVTLLIVDQRPSQIYDEVLSQLGTRVSGRLEDDADIQAVLSGLAGKDMLRGMLSHLQPKEEVLLLGWGVPMPIPVKSRRYDARFWEELLGRKSGRRGAGEILKELGY